MLTNLCLYLYCLIGLWQYSHVSKVVTLFLCFYCMSLCLPLEPSLTATNLCSLLAHVKDWRGTVGLPRYLHIPTSKLWEMERLYPDPSHRQSALMQYFLDEHPAPSWELVCFALYVKEEYEVLENVQNKYFKGTVYT